MRRLDLPRLRAQLEPSTRRRTILQIVALLLLALYTMALGSIALLRMADVCELPTDREEPVERR